MKTRPTRRGYAMVLVLVFIATLLCLYSVAYRQVAAALRIEKARVLQRHRDEGRIHALARGLKLLETGLPPSDAYTCGVTIETPTGPRALTVTFALESAEENIWLVAARPTGPFEDPPPMPAMFAESGP
jgi:hypothetical protein